jgi:hypothetical protein
MMREYCRAFFHPKGESSMKRFFAALFTGVLTLSCLPAFAGESLYEAFSRRGTIKVHVETPKDSTGKDIVLTDDLKKKIEAALEARKSLRFAIEPSAASADVVVSVDVAELMWTDHDPVDMLVGIGATAMDAAVRENYARMLADIAVKDARSGATLWKDRVRATLTSKTMTEEQSRTMINDDLAKVFIKEAFARKRR